MIRSRLSCIICCFHVYAWHYISSFQKSLQMLLGLRGVGGDNTVLIACSNTPCTPSPVRAEHSK